MAIKIKKADRSSDKQELQVLQRLQRCHNPGAGAQCVVQLLDAFTHRGPNGSNQCLVLELLGPTLGSLIRDAYDCDGRLEPDVIVQSSVQLLQAVGFVHEVGFAIGGRLVSMSFDRTLAASLADINLLDISAYNVAVYNARLPHLSEVEIFEALGPPEHDELRRIDRHPLGPGLPKQLIRSTQWCGWPLDDEENDEDIRIIDLGEAFDINTSVISLAQPPDLQAPEAVFANQLDYRQDLWKMGLVVSYPRDPGRIHVTNGCIDLSSRIWHTSMELVGARRTGGSHDRCIWRVTT